MKISSRTTSLLLALLLIIPAAAAEIDTVLYSHEAEFNSPTDITKVCGCGQTVDAFELTNRGDFPSGFAITLEADEDWISVPADFIYLEAEENATVAVVLEPGCDERGDDAEYSIYATSEFGRFRAAHRTVDVLACQPIGLELEPEHRTVLPCSPAEFNLQLTNTASYEETYTIILSPEGLQEQSRQVTLGPGAEFSDTFSVLWPCNDHGAKDILVTVVAERTGVEQNAIATVDILDDYSFVASLEQESVCAEVLTTTTLEITNTASIRNTYTLESRTPFATVEDEQVTIDAGDTIEVPISLRPDEAYLGGQEVRVSVTSEFGEATQVVSAPLEVRDCYEHRVTVTPPSVTACAGPQNLSVRIENFGEDTERYTLHTAGDIFSEFARESFTLRTGEHANILLHALIPDRTQAYEILVETAQTPGIQSTTVIPVQAVSNADCTLITPATTEIDLYTDDVVVPLLVENQGVKAATYQVEYEGRVLQPDEEDLFLAPGEQAIIHLRLDGTDNTGTYIETLRLVSDRAEYRYDLAIDIDEKSIFTRAYEALAFSEAKWCLWGAIIMALLVLVMIAALILLRIGAIQNPRLKDSTRYAWTVVLLGLAAILVVVGVFAALSVPGPGLAEEPAGDMPGELYFEVVQNGETVIDLGQYFEDPEGDVLRFRATQPENLMVRIDGDQAIIRPDRGYTGIERLAFTAIDPENATADSPVMTVRVLRTETRTFGAWLGLYCGVLIWWLLALLLLLGAWSMYITKDRKLEKRYGERVRAVIVPERGVARTPAVPAAPVPPTPARPRAEVHGDVVAGDKVTYEKGPETFVASSTGSKIHRTSCPIAERIPKNKREVYTKRDEAVKAGYNACKLCKPFE